MTAFNRLSGLTAALVLAIIIAANMPATRQASADPDDDIHISVEAELLAQTKYRKLKRHKALAVGPIGRYAYGWDYPSAKQAEKGALEACRKDLKAAVTSQYTQRKCILYDSDGKLTGRGKPQGVSLDFKLTEPDPPYQRGRKIHPDGTAIGTIIFLHGCNGLGTSGWQLAWESFYTAAGYRVISPDSFADIRDPVFCSTPGRWPNNEDNNRLSRNIKYRIAQTRRTINLVRRVFPEKPIYVHGHSEGGLVAQLLDEKIGGVIVTGATCGLWGSRLSRTPPKVPTLVIVGTKDAFVPEGKTAKSLARHCVGVAGAGPMTVVSVEGMGHYAAVWWPKVAQAVGKFLKFKPAAEIADRTDEVKTLPRIPPEFYAAPEHKALAAASAAEYFYDSGYETANDALQAALFGCDARLRWNAFKEASKKHGCVVVNVTNPKQGTTQVGN
jgi:pimeloyl-ACP methyl ester carboxylesterase